MDEGQRRRSSIRDWPALRPGGEQFGPYRLLEKIGDGGFAEVFLAEPRGGGDKVVVKRLHQHLEAHHESVEMFLTEARVMAELEHPHIVGIEHFDSIDGQWSIVMERVDGADLAFVFDLAQDLGQTLPVRAAVRVVAEVAEALHYAHERSAEGSGEALEIIHRDIKPDNILVGWDGSARIIDFGCAKATVQSELTRPGIRKGTLDYMSPEQCLGRPLDRRTDIFSLGVVLYELVTMSRLYADASDARVMERIAHEITRPPSWANSEINAPLDLIVLRALEKRPDDRFETAGEMARALRWWLSRYGGADVSPEDGEGELGRWLRTHVRPRMPGFREASGDGAAFTSGALVIREPSDLEVDLAPPGRQAALDSKRLSALQSIVARRSNLSPEGGATFGRQELLVTIQEAFDRGQQLVSLSGEAGVGKTHLADAFAREALQSSPTRLGGVWWVDASQVEELTALPVAVAQVLELPGGEPVALVREVAEALQVRGPTLIVIDGLGAFEADPTALFVHWTSAAPELELLVTREQPSDDEAAFDIRVPPLSLPRDPRLIAQSAAGELFVHAVRQRHPDFTLTKEITSAVCDLLRELGGNPAATLMAAASIAEEDPVAALSSRRRPEVSGSGIDERTLASAVEWSWEQLDDDERIALEVATVFHGGFDSVAAKAVLAPFLSTPVDQVLARLEGRSLISSWEPGECPGERRHKVVRAMRGWAREQLVAGGRGRQARRAHADHFLAVTERLAAGCHGPDGPAAVRRMRLEMSNIHAVLQRALRVRPATRASGQRALEVAVHLWAYADVRGRYPDYLELLAKTLDATRKVDVPVLLRARSLLRMCRAGLECGDVDRARQAVELAQRVAHEVDEPGVLGRIAQASGELYIALGRFADAREFLQIAAAQLEDAGAEREVARAYLALGQSIIGEARLETAESCILTARERFADAGALHGEAIAIAELGALLDRLDRVDEAAELLRQAVSVFRSFGDRRRHAEVLLRLARVARGQGDFDAARRCCEEAVSLARRHGAEDLQRKAMTMIDELHGATGGVPMARRESWVVAAEGPPATPH